MGSSTQLNPYRDPINNIRYLNALFYEKTLSDKSTVLYTLKSVDHKGYPSLKQLYIKECLSDPTEYTFANKYLEDYDHWIMLTKCNWFKDTYLARWRNEIELATAAKALKRLVAVSEDTDDKNYYAANRYLLDKGYLDKRAKNTKGRPSKQDIKDAATDAAYQQQQQEEDFKRVTNDDHAKKVN